MRTVLLAFFQQGYYICHQKHVQLKVITMRKLLFIMLMFFTCLSASAGGVTNESEISDDQTQVVQTPVHPEFMTLLNYVPVRVYVRSLLNSQPVINCTVTLIVEHRDDNGNLINTWQPISRSTDSHGCASFVCGKPLFGYIWPKAYLGGVDVTSMMFNCTYDYNDWIYDVWI